LQDAEAISLCKIRYHVVLHRFRQHIGKSVSFPRLLRFDSCQIDTRYIGMQVHMISARFTTRSYGSGAILTGLCITGDRASASWLGAV
jgi:hypothetical protein